MIYRSTAANVRALINHINSSNNTYYLDTWEYSIRSLLGYSYQEIPFVEPVTPWQYLEDGKFFTSTIELYLLHT